MKRPSAIALLALTLVLGVSAALAHVYVHLQLIQVGYALSTETKLRHDLGEQNQKLRLELAVRKDPGQIERRARQELHMEAPDPSLIRVLRLREPTAVDTRNVESRAVPAVAGRAAPRGREARR